MSNTFFFLSLYIPTRYQCFSVIKNRCLLLTKSKHLYLILISKNASFTGYGNNYKMVVDMESVQASIVRPTRKPTHELIYFEVIVDAMLPIATRLGNRLSVNEIKLGHIYYEDSDEASREWRLPGKRHYIDINWDQERRN